MTTQHTNSETALNEERSARGCPFHDQPSRKTTPPGEEHRSAARVQKDASGVWHIYGFAEAKALLRSGGTRQAGFMAERVALLPDTMRPPVLFQEGKTHHEQRAKTARFFTPTTTEKNYRAFMETYADELIAELRAQKRTDVSALSMKLAVQVAAQVVGLTDSRVPGMAGRINAFFEQRRTQSRAGRFLEELLGQWRTAKFFFLDVQSAISARRRTPKEDLISHLIGEGYSGSEILTECITFAAAGMVTTREFICAAAWHLLEHPDLKTRYLAAPQEERYTLLHELLRLEPVVGHLLRRAQEDIELQSAGQRVTISTGDLVDLHVYGVNADEEAVGETPLSVCPERERAAGVQPYAMSFGDGHHRCPGAFIAVQETDIFLTRLLTLEGLVLEQSPELTFNEVVKGYELRNFWVRLEGD